MDVRLREIDAALAAARRGEQRGFSALFALLAGRVAEYLRTRDAWDVDGLTNEVFLAAFSGLHAFDGDADQFRGWVFTIARNKAIDDARRRASRPPLASVAAATGSGPTGDVEADVFVHLGREWVTQLLTDLTPEQREVVVLRLLDDLSVREVAEIVGKPEDAVKALQHRAVRRLRTKFSHDPSPTGSDVR